jgi:TolB-like protein
MNIAVSGTRSGAVTPHIAGVVGRPTACRIARIHLFGPMRAISYLGEDILPRGKKARALLAYLCLASGTKVDRTHLASLLWDESSSEHARGSLRRALSELCTAMGPLAAELVSAGRTAIRLDTHACWIDASAVLESSSPDSVRSDLALLCAGELLEGLAGVSASFDRWLSRERQRVREKRAELREVPIPISSPGYLQTHARPLPAAGSYPQRALPARNRLRLAVLPFDGQGGGKSAERAEDFAFSLSYDIATALTRFRWFDVITPISFMSGPLVHFTSEDLLHGNQLDYVADGVVTRHGRLIEINVRLLDLARGTQPVWSERFELPATELHRLSEMVAGRVVSSIDPIILFIEGQPNRREHYGATGLLLLAIPLLYSAERTKFERAGVLIHQALEMDPQNATALAWAACWHLTRVDQGWAQDLAGTLATAETLCRKAMAIDRDNAEALGMYAHTCAWKKDFDAAVHYFDRSLRLNPNLAFVWALSAATYCYIGEPAAALQRLKRYRELAPFDQFFYGYEAVYALACTFNGDYEQAVLVGRGAVRANPDYSAGYKPLIAALGHLGRSEEAQPYVAKLLSLEPHFSVERFGKTYPFKRAADRARYMHGLELAGVPAVEAS